MTTRKGLVALSVLTVVMGRYLRATIPLIHEEVTMTALTSSARWLWRSVSYLKSQGERKRVERAVATSRICSTPLFWEDFFLAMS